MEQRQGGGGGLDKGTSLMEARQRYLEEMSADHSADYLIALDLDCQEVAKRAVLNAGPTRRRELLLCEAAADGRLIDVCRLLANVRLDVAAKDGQTALHSAARNNRWTVASLLLASQADPNAVDTGGTKETPLHSATRSGATSVLRLLLESRGDPEYRSNDGETPYDLAKTREVQEAFAGYFVPVHSDEACGIGNVEASCEAKNDQSESDKGSTLGSEDRDEDDAAYKALPPTSSNKTSVPTPEERAENVRRLHAAVNVTSVTPSELSVIEGLLVAGTDLNSPDDSGCSPLHLACVHGLTEVVTTLLEYGADAQTTTETADTPLHYATFAKHISIVQLLLDHDADPLARNLDGLSSIDIAKGSEAFKVLNVLNSVASAKGLVPGAEESSEDEFVADMLKSKSRRQGSGSIVGKAVEKPPRKQRRVAEERLRRSLREFIRTGDDAGAANILESFPFGQIDPDATRTASMLHLCAQHGRPQIAEMLCNHGVELNRLGPRKMTALHIAAESGNAAVAEVLARHGADLGYVDMAGRSPLDIASDEVCAVIVSASNFNGTSRSRRPYKKRAKSGTSSHTRKAKPRSSKPNAESDADKLKQAQEMRREQLWELEGTVETIDGVQFKALSYDSTDAMLFDIEIIPSLRHLLGSDPTAADPVTIRAVRSHGADKGADKLPLATVVNIHARLPDEDNIQDAAASDLKEPHSQTPVMEAAAIGAVDRETQSSGGASVTPPYDANERGTATTEALSDHESAVDSSETPASPLRPTRPPKVYGSPAFGWAF